MLYCLVTSQFVGHSGTKGAMG